MASVTAVDPETRQLTLDLGGEQVTLGPGYLEDRTVHGDPTLQHGYAMTVHVAQGLTVDHAFVLAGAGLNRELGYTALSRGRETNQLYAARDPDTGARRVRARPTRTASTRSPASPPNSQTSSETTLAIDTGHPATPERALADAEEEHRRAVAQRRAAASARGRWLPRRRRELEHLRDAETRLARRVEDLRRRQTEQRHGARPFIEDRDDHTRYREMARLIAERRLKREIDRAAERERARDLER